MYDVAIIGAGVVGGMIARTLAKESKVTIPISVFTSSVLHKSKTKTAPVIFSTRERSFAERFFLFMFCLPFKNRNCPFVNKRRGKQNT